MTLARLNDIGKLSRRLNILQDHALELADEIKEVQNILEVLVQEIIREERE